MEPCPKIKEISAMKIEDRSVFEVIKFFGRRFCDADVFDFFNPTIFMFLSSENIFTKQIILSLSGKKRRYLL